MRGCLLDVLHRSKMTAENPVLLNPGPGDNFLTKINFVLPQNKLYSIYLSVLYNIDLIWLYTCSKKKNNNNVIDDDFKF